MKPPSVRFVELMGLDTRRWPVVEVRWQVLPDGGWLSTHIITPFVREERAVRWFDQAPTIGFAERLWDMLGLAIEAWEDG